MEKRKDEIIISEFVFVTYINTTPEKLWEALTNTEFMKQYWFGSSFETDWKVGSKIKETMKDGKPGFQGKILKFEPPQVLSYTFYTEGEAKTQVTFDIKPQGATVKLTTTHEGYEQCSKDYQSIRGGWSAVLSSLKSFLETGKPLEIDEVQKNKVIKLLDSDCKSQRVWKL